MNARYFEAAGSITGLLGAWLLALKGDHAGYGFAAFLASNAAFIAFAWIRGLWWFLAMQLGYTASSALGIWRWLL